MSLPCLFGDAGFGKTALGRSPCEMAGARVGASRAVDGGQPQGGDPAVLWLTSSGQPIEDSVCCGGGAGCEATARDAPRATGHHALCAGTWHWHELDGLPQVPDRTGTECATEDGHGATARCDTGRRPAPRVLYLKAMMGTRVSRAVSGDAPVTDRQRDRDTGRDRVWTCSFASLRGTNEQSTKQPAEMEDDHCKSGHYF